MLGQEWEDHDLVFASERGTPMFARNFLRAFRSAVSRSGIENHSEIHPHTLRHTAATHWLDAGVPSFEVARRLGHTSTRVTESTYAHVLRGGQRRSSGVMAALIA